MNRWDNLFQLVRCRRCGLIYQNPQLTLDELSAYYPDTYVCFRPDVESERSRFVRLDRRFELTRRCARIMRHRPKPGRFLDVGCATGLFLAAMRDRGWQVTGVEINTYAAEYARRTFGLDVRLETLEEVAFEDASFDLVSLWGVLEHVADPKATLAETARVLKPGGLLVMALPNPTCLEARLFGASWIGWDRPRHLHLFTPQVMKRYLTGAGFALDGIESFVGRLGLTLLNVELWCKARRLPEKKWRPALRLLYLWPFRVLSWPVYWVGEAFNQTTNMVVFATRRK